MSLPDTKLEKLTSAVLQDAEEQRAKILQEIEDFRRTEMDKAEEEVLHEAYIMIQNEIAAIKNDHSRKISLAEIESRRKILKLRDEITEAVFKDAADRVLAYTKTPEYADDLCAAVQKYAQRIPSGDVVIRLKADDIALGNRIVAAFGRPASCEASPEIALGGVILFNREAGVVVNETLDLKLTGQRDWFATASGLTLG